MAWVVSVSVVFEVCDDGKGYRAMLVDPGFDCVLCSHFCSSVPLCTVSLRGKGTYMCPCWTGCTSTIPRSTLAGSCCVKTTAPMRQSSSRCELFHIAFPEERDVEGKKIATHNGVRYCVRRIVHNLNMKCQFFPISVIYHHLLHAPTWAYFMLLDILTSKVCWDWQLTKHNRWP